jgi:hypothetical protein
MDHRVAKMNEKFSWINFGSRVCRITMYRVFEGHDRAVNRPTIQ